MTIPTITRNWTGSITLRFPYDADLVASLKDEIPGHARTYDPVGKSWAVTASYAHIASRLMHQTFLEVAVEERARPGSSSARAPHAGDPSRTLHLLPSAPPELVLTEADPRRPCRPSTPRWTRSGRRRDATDRPPARAARPA